jgi:hypothetical protein
MKIKASETIAKMREVVELRFIVIPPFFGFIDKDCGLRK